MTGLDSQHRHDGILMKQVIPSDNCCLFTSLQFALNHTVDTDVAPSMRRMVAEEISKDPLTFNDVFLGQGNEEYCNWIQQEDSWGGAIELSIFSQIYCCEIAVLNSVNGSVSVFGEDKQYPNRIYLIFDGIHYDTLFLDVGDGTIETIFSANDHVILKQAQELAKEAQSSQQFTDLNKFTLKCYDCGQLLVGQNEARDHARKTTHVHFGEISSTN